MLSKTSISGMKNGKYSTGYLFWVISSLSMTDFIRSFCVMNTFIQTPKPSSVVKLRSLTPPSDTARGQWPSRR